jgi:hypothetical protein
MPSLPAVRAKRGNSSSRAQPRPASSDHVCSREGHVTSPAHPTSLACGPRASGLELPRFLSACWSRRGAPPRVPPRPAAWRSARRGAAVSPRVGRGRAGWAPRLPHRTGEGAGVARARDGTTCPPAAAPPPGGREGGYSFIPGGPCHGRRTGQATDRAQLPRLPSHPRRSLLYLYSSPASCLHRRSVGRKEGPMRGGGGQC